MSLKINIETETENETMNKIYKNKCSICRFGDGEIYHLFRTNSKFCSGGQNCNYIIQQKLIEILKQENKKVIIGFSGYFNNIDIVKDRYKLEKLSKITKTFFRKYKIKLKNNFPFLFEKKLYSAEITRLQQLKNNKYIIEIFNKLFEENECIFIGNNKIINIIKYDLMINFKNIIFISAPHENAFNKYDEILENLHKIDNLKNKLILVSLGITATIMCYDLAINGYWSIDIGHYFELLLLLHK